MVARTHQALALVLAGPLACGPAAESSTGFTTPGTTSRGTTLSSDPSGGSSTSTSTTSSSTSSTGGAESGAGTSSGPVWDMGTPPDFDPTPPGCQGKIDFLFIVSRDDFMKPHQDQLVAAFPDFIETIQSQFSDFDVQILVTDTEPSWGNATCEKDCPNTCVAEPAYPCEYWPTECDTTMGAGVVMNVGPYTTNVPCLDGPLRYIITRDTPDVPATFECLARVGTVGYNMIGDALVGAMSYKLNKVGGCNEGFIRDDALLMVTIIGPEDTVGPGHSQGTWQEWMKAVVDRKKGNLDAIVMFVLTDDCMGLSDPDYRLCRMVPEFPRNLLGILTTPDYGPIFDEAAALALEACSAFVPG